jgi:Tfp pilus assembly protein PilO
MSRGKKIFVLLAVVFVILLAYASYDISRKTTFPGSKSQLKERLKEKYEAKDSVSNDSVNVFSKKN